MLRRLCFSVKLSRVFLFLGATNFLVAATCIFLGELGVVAQVPQHMDEILGVGAIISIAVLDQLLPRTD